MAGHKNKLTKLGRCDSSAIKRLNNRTALLLGLQGLLDQTAGTTTVSALVENLFTWWRHLRWLQKEPPAALVLFFKIGHQMGQDFPPAQAKSCHPIFVAVFFEVLHHEKSSKQ